MLDMTREWEEKRFGVGPMAPPKRTSVFSFLDLSCIKSQVRVGHIGPRILKAPGRLGIRPSGSLIVEGLGARY